MNRSGSESIILPSRSTSSKGASSASSFSEWSWGKRRLAMRLTMGVLGRVSLSGGGGKEDTSSSLSLVVSLAARGEADRC